MSSNNHYYHEKSQRIVTAFMKRIGRDRFKRSEIFVNHLQIIVPQLPPQFDNYHIVHYSDIHFGHWVTPKRLEGIVDMINELQPDLVVNTGDFVSYVLDDLALALTNSLRRIEGPDGKLAVLGNHDHWLDLAKIRGILQDAGMTELANDVTTIDRQGAQLHIAGVDDIIVGAHDLDQVMARMPVDGPAIMLAHEPDFADETAATGRFFLQLSGHSHGTQLVPPFIGPIFRGQKFQKYFKGAYKVGEMIQYTSNGVGTHTLHLRVNCPPEIVSITLRPDPLSENGLSEIKGSGTI